MIGGEPKAYPSDATCLVDGCKRRPHARSLCDTHYGWIAEGKVDAPALLPRRNDGPCGAEGCDRRAFCRGFCRRHYERLRKYGDPTYRPRPGIDYDNKVGRGAANANWRGNDITYSSAHSRVRYTKGAAKDYQCACGEQARCWAYNGADPNQLYGAGSKGSMMFYSPDPAYYDPMCAKCHATSDHAPIKALRVWMYKSGVTMEQVLQLVGVTP